MKYREVEGTEEHETWRLRLFGTFSLTAPSGLTVELHNQKCEGLLAILAVVGKSGVRREIAAQALWPDKPLPKQQESLRQALSILRQQTCSEFITSNRTHCAFGGIPIECDYDQPNLRVEPTFMPYQQADWFEQIRAQLEQGEEGREESSVMTHCLEYLRWSARRDPKGLYAFFRTNRYFVRGLPNHELLSVLNKAGRPEGVCGWADYWRGSVEDELDQCAVHLRRAFALAIKEPDWELASEVCFELGKVYARLGDADRARKVTKASEEVAERSKLSIAALNATRLRGTLLVHWGQIESGLVLLRQTADQIDDSVRRMVVESTQALFEAMAGRYGCAAQSLEIGETLAYETGHQQTSLLNSLTRALLSIHEGPRWNALPLLDSTAARSYGSKARQLGVYADEVSAKLHLLDRDREAAMSKLGSARTNRLQSRMARTPLESSMVAAVR